jgi:hypothetical protein
MLLKTISITISSFSSYFQNNIFLNGILFKSLQIGILKPSNLVSALDSQPFFVRTIPPEVGCINLILSRLQSVAYQLEGYGLTGKHLLPDTFHQVVAHDTKEKMLTKVA